MNAEFRAQMKTWLEKKREADGLADKDNTSEDILLQHYGVVDEELGKLIVMLDDDQDDGDGGADVADDGEATEILSLYEQADPVRYIQLMEEEKPLDGAEHELNAALKMARPNTMPIGLLLRDDELKPDEELADAVTSITTQTTVNTSPIAARVFKQTAAMLMGFQMPTVASGTQRYPFLTAGTNAKVVGPGTSVDAAAATLSTVEVDPVALQATYILDRESIMRHGNELQTLLQNDLRMVMGSALDDEILQGDGATPTRRKGLFPFIKANTVIGGDLTAKVSWGDAESMKADFVDSLYFMEDTATRMLIGLDTYKYLRKLYPPSGGNRIDPLVHALQAIRNDGVTVFVRDRVPASVAAASGSNGKYQDALYVGGEGPSNVLVPVWSDMDLLMDPYTAGRKRQVQMTLVMFFGLAYRRSTLDGTDTTIGEIPGVKKIRWVESADA